MIKVLELFGGIGACSKAFERLKIPFEIVDYVEIDKYAVKSFNAIHGTNFEPQDITKWNKKIDVDLIMHGSPCQDFSVAGKNLGGDKNSGTRSSLMYETIRIVDNLKPKVVIWENVKNLLSKKHKHNFDEYIKTMNDLGYKSYYKILNAKDYGIPQNRERVFTISIRNDIKKEFNFPKEQELKLKLIDMLEQNVDEKYYLSDRMMSYLLSESKTGISRKKIFERNFKPKDIAYTITTMAGQRPSDNYIPIKTNNKKGYIEAYVGDGVYTNITKNKRGTVQNQMSPTITTYNDKGVIVDYFNVRKLTPCECWSLMGFDKTDFEKASKVVSNSQLYKQAGNSIVVNVLENIIKELMKVVIK